MLLGIQSLDQLRNGQYASIKRLHILNGGGYGKDRYDIDVLRIGFAIAENLAAL